MIIHVCMQAIFRNVPYQEIYRMAIAVEAKATKAYSKKKSYLGTSHWFGLGLSSVHKYEHTAAQIRNSKPALNI